jgi:RHS repeat-associated protein
VSVYSATDGRLSQISNPLIPNQLFNYSYLPSSDLLSAVSGPVHTTTHTWEPNRDVLDLKQNKVGTSIVSSYDYAVNAIGQRTGVATSGTAFLAVPSWAWSYDSLGQVIRADSNVNTRDRAYQYDAIGNRQKTANSLTLPVANNYAANALNQYTSVQQGGTGVSPVYDTDGNATAYPLPTAPTTNSTLTWDAENRLIATTVSGITTRYQYDAQSRCIAKTAGTSTTSVATLYLYDAWNCIAEHSRSAGAAPAYTLKKTRLWGTDFSGSMQGAGGVGGLLCESQISNSQISNYHPTYDGNGNVSEYLTATGTTAAHFEYDPFGNTVVNTDTGNQFTYRFSTKPRDQETGLYYYGYRYYDPTTGRWPSRDPIRERGGSNMYGFLKNDGTNKTDYLGKSPVVAGVGIGAALCYGLLKFFDSVLTARQEQEETNQAKEDMVDADGDDLEARHKDLEMQNMDARDANQKMGEAGAGVGGTGMQGPTTAPTGGATDAAVGAAQVGIGILNDTLGGNK